MNVEEAKKWAVKTLESNQVENPASSVDFLLRNALSIDKSFLLTHPERQLSLVEERRFRNWIKKRKNHMPVWYITGKIEFFNQDFYVNKNVLIPRPETELLIEKVLTENQKLRENSKILDIGTGSGAIILTLARSLQGQFFASDILGKALEVAKKNADSLNYRTKILFKKGDLFSPWRGQKFDLIVANLPYVPHKEMDALAPDLIHYEPIIALDGGNRGLEVYRRFFEQAPNFLNKKGKIYCEIGHHQGLEVKKLAQKHFQGAKIEIFEDYAKIDRIISIQIK